MSIFLKVFKMNVRDLSLPWIITAESHFGIKEIPGSKSNKIIMEWAERLGGWVEDYYDNDDIPWCGLFVAECMRENDIPITIKNPLSAKAWSKFGIPCQPKFGAIMVFTRSGGGHVGFYVSEDDDTFHILGGNQSNQVNVTKVSKGRFLEARWPSEYEYLINESDRIYKDFDGTISENEA